MQRLIVALGALVLVAGAITFVAPGFLDGAAAALRGPGTPLSTVFTVTDDGGNNLTHRLVVLFLNGAEIGRTDDAGAAHGSIPPGTPALPPTVTIREGDVLVLTFPPGPQVVAYAFPGDRQQLSFAVQTCGLQLAVDGTIRCPQLSPDIPVVVVLLMAATLMFLMFPLSLLALRHIEIWPSEISSQARFGLSAGAALALSTLVVVMFVTTGVMNQWVLKLTEIFSGAATVLVAAIGSAVAFLLFATQVRSFRMPKR